MNKILIFICCSMGIMAASYAATPQSTATNTTPFNYNYMYPYMNNQMRRELNPGTSVEINANPINAVVRTASIPVKGRRVVARPTAQRSDTSATQPGNGAIRPNTNTNITKRRVVARSAAVQANSRTNNNRRRVVARSARGDASYLANATSNAALVQNNAQTVSSSRCLADYIECMNGYCARENTRYNRCYCSARLSQIDAKYQADIDRMINQILTIQTVNKWTDEEMSSYWQDTVGKYTNTDSWANIDNALDIDWASMESRVRGQQAFVSGHTYCSQHLNGCYYMATNMRDAYRSEISRDCDSYEANLQTIKNIAESILEANK